MVRLKVLFVHDHSLDDWKGGAQIEIDLLMKIGNDLHHECELMTPKTFNKQKIDGQDLLVLNGLSDFSEEQIEYMMTKPYVKWHHDYSYRRNLKLFKRLCDKALVNFFLSPLHYIEFSKDIKTTSECLIIPPPFELEKFKDLGFNKWIDYLFVGRFSKAKGVDSVIINAKLNPNKVFCFVNVGPEEVGSVKGYMDIIKKLPNVHIYSNLAVDELIKLYNSSKILIHLPNWKEPFGRIVVEAKLCGCDVLANSNVGCLSYDWFYNIESMKQALELAPYIMWEVIGKKWL